MIIYFVLKKSNGNTGDTTIIKILSEQCNLKNIQYKRTTNGSKILTGMKQGEEYIVIKTYIYSAINENMIYDIKSRIMDKEHYHNGIIVVNNVNTISQRTREIANENGIEFASLSARQIDNPYNKSSNTNNSPIKTQEVINYNKYEEDEAIQSGSHAKSIFSNFFGNKVERL